MFKPKNIIVPTDFSECSVNALRQAKEFVEQFDSEITLLYVKSKEASELPLYFLDDDKVDEINKHMDEHIEHELVRIAKEVFGENGYKPKLEVAHGVSYEEIIKYADKTKADLIVISSKGKSAIEGFFYGSTTEKVVRKAHCSVFIVRKVLD
ncbi:universal stress protein [Limisalsivibrio acetivorans]|uniref:universal stress protein n=1 Tax=Limisalsivibrio acetivorans TaxID=1304888 RepID=UPI0003B622A6|nr:universal stress protein [Limisalsivibrio acetivorans]